MIVWNFQAMETAIFYAGTNPSTWARALNAVTEKTESFGAILFPASGRIPPNAPCSDRMREFLQSYFRETRHVQAEMNWDGVIVMKNGVANALKNDEKIYQQSNVPESLAPAGWGSSVEIRSKCGNDLWSLSIRRSMAQRPFSAEEQHKLRQLSQSLSSAIGISRAVGVAATKAALDAFELSATAVLLIDGSGKVIQANQSAHQLLTGDVKLSGGRLISKDPTTPRVVEQALYNLLGNSEAAMAVPIPLPRARLRPLLMYLLKLSSLSSNPFAECQAIAILIDPERRWVPTEMALRATFGFTPAEARLAARISSGAALDTVATSLGITKQTLRSLLKIIFAKAGVHRQAELVALVGSTANAARGTLDSLAEHLVLLV